MLRNLVIGCAVIQMVSSAPLVAAAAADFGTAEEAKAVAAVKEDKAKALDTFNKGEGGFKDRSVCLVRQCLRRHRDGDTLLE